MIRSLGIRDSCTHIAALADFDRSHHDLVADRTERFAHIVGPENVIAGTDCGFSTFAGLTMVGPAIT